MVSFACSSVNDPLIVMIAAGMTLGITRALTVYALTTKSDFTMMGGAFFIFGIGLLLFGLFGSLFFNRCPILHIFYCLIGVIFYGLYLVYDI